VAPHEVARQIIARVMPGVDPAVLDFTPAPDRARRRAWLQYKNLGVAHDEQVLAARRGFLTRRVAVIPHARTQSVGISQGPWQRRLGLASVQVDSTPGPVSIVVLHRSAGEARRIAEEQLVRAAASRATGPGDRWMTGPRAPQPARSDSGDRDPAAPAPTLAAPAPAEAAPMPAAPVSAEAVKELGQGSP
jgi:putative membrane protein